MARYERAPCHVVDARYLGDYNVWLQFSDAPTPRTWYRAHNASILAGYLAHRDLAERGAAEHVVHQTLASFGVHPEQV